MALEVMVSFFNCFFEWFLFCFSIVGDINGVKWFSMMAFGCCSCFETFLMMFNRFLLSFLMVFVRVFSFF